MTNRHMLVVAHTGRAEALEAGVQVCAQLASAGVTPVVSPTQESDFVGAGAAGLKLLGKDVPLDQIDLTIVVGGDGTILLAAEITRGSSAPLLGINHGHVGFLAESEKDDLAWTVAKVLSGEYDVDERLVLDVRVLESGKETFHTFALNEATVEKASRARMIEVSLEVDERPLSTFGADGVVIATPTGSTAYSFSAGGPIVWPEVEALLMVPLSAHALFSRPIVVGPSSVLAVELLERSLAGAVLWCDGRRGVDIHPGARVVVKASSEPIRLARLHPGPFTDRLVQKFSLPVTGWRGPGKK